MKKKSRWLVAIGLVLALTLVLVPAQVMAEPDGAVDPNGPYYPPAGGTFTVHINIDNVTDLSAGQFELTYDDTVIDYVTGSAVKGDFWGAMGFAVIVIPNEPGAGRLQVVFYDAMGGGFSGGGSLVDIDFDVVGGSCDISDLNLSAQAASFPNGLTDSSGADIASTWSDGLVEVDGPCATPTPTPTPKQHIVVSGKLLLDGTAKPVDPCPTLLPYDMWGDTGNDWGEWAPPRTTGRDSRSVTTFHPCEWIVGLGL